MLAFESMPHTGISTKVNGVLTVITPATELIYSAFRPVEHGIATPKRIQDCNQQHNQNKGQHWPSQGKSKCHGTPVTAACACHGHSFGQTHCELRVVVLLL